MLLNVKVKLKQNFIKIICKKIKKEDYHQNIIMVMILIRLKNNVDWV